jgi:hypothetical protein
MVYTDLHHLCAQTDRTDAHWRKLLRYLQSHRREASEELDDGKLPLHFVLANRAVPLPVVVALVEAYPEAVYCRESAKGYLPLHSAIRSGCDVDVVAYLIKLYPGALRCRTRRNFICCIEEYILLFRGKALTGMSCLDLAKLLPKDHPNRTGLIQLLQQKCYSSYQQSNVAIGFHPAVAPLSK